MTFTAFDIALPIGLGAAFGLFRYFEWVKSAPDQAMQKAAMDALKGMAGMGVMTVVMKYLNMI